MSAESSTQVRQQVVDWLMQGDPTIRWQVMRDLLDEDEVIFRREQKRGRLKAGESRCYQTLFFPAALAL